MCYKHRIPARQHHSSEVFDFFFYQFGLKHVPKKKTNLSPVDKIIFKSLLSRKKIYNESLIEEARNLPVLVYFNV